MGGQGLLLLMELKFLIMMTRLQNFTVSCLLLKVIVVGNSNVLRPGHHHQHYSDFQNSPPNSILVFGKIFRSIELMLHLVGATTNCEKIL